MNSSMAATRSDALLSLPRFRHRQFFGWLPHEISNATEVDHCKGITALRWIKQKIFCGC